MREGNVDLIPNNKLASIGLASLNLYEDKLFLDAFRLTN
jgi:hypothetical protein